jgi:hypothetical protein
MAKHEFYYEATIDPRKGYPYVAKLIWKEGKLEREFYNLKRSYGDLLSHLREVGASPFTEGSALSRGVSSDRSSPTMHQHQVYYTTIYLYLIKDGDFLW